MKKTIKLKDIADIQTGYTFRSGVDVDDSADVKLVQMKNLNRDEVCCGDLDRVDMEVKDSQRLKQFDLVFRTRGLSAMAAILRENIGEALLASPLMRVRVKDVGRVMPEYLCWYINNRSERYFASRSEGSVRKVISKSMLAELSVFVPSIEKQQLIVDVYGLWLREQSLRSELAEKRKQYVDVLLEKLEDE